MARKANIPVVKTLGRKVIDGPHGPITVVLTTCTGHGFPVFAVHLNREFIGEVSPHPMSFGRGSKPLKKGWGVSVNSRGMKHDEPRYIRRRDSVYHIREIATKLVEEMA